MQSDAASLSVASDVRLVSSRRTSLSERRMTARSFFFLLFFITYLCLSGRSRGEHLSWSWHSHGEHRLTNVKSKVDSAQYPGFAV
jgi:hypothetical protein